MRFHWFIRKGFIFLPVSLIGWIVLMLTGLVAVYTFIDIDSHSHSVSDTLINFMFNLLLLAVGYSLIAFFTSSGERD
jgi:hypothetical protein